MEACQLNRLVIATDIEANLEATNGSMLRILPRNIESLSNALIQAAEMDPADRLRVSILAQGHALASHDLNDRIDDMERIYLETLGRPVVLATPLAYQT